METPVQKVVIVNGNAAILDLVEEALEYGHYDLVFVETHEHAYSQIKRTQPDLVILCLDYESSVGFEVLSMLKLDEDTRSIPVLTYTCRTDASDDEESSGAEEPEMPNPVPAIASKMS